MKYISILRGINVSGQKKIKMLDLKVLYETLGFQNVVTYIQSGNVVFDSNDKKISDITIKIENAISRKYKFAVPVQIRTKSDFQKIIKDIPFSSVDLVEEDTKVLVTFLSEKPDKEKITAIEKFVISPERLVVKGKHVYLYCPNGYGKSKLSNTFLENKLGVVATTRNWKSVSKLHEMAV